MFHLSTSEWLWPGLGRLEERTTCFSRAPRVTKRSPEVVQTTHTNSAFALAGAMGSNWHLNKRLPPPEVRLTPNHTLLLRFALVNIVALGLIGAAWMQGWLDGFGEKRTWIISLGIFVVFVWGLVLTAFHLMHMNRALHSLAAGEQGRGTPYGATFERLKAVSTDERTLATSMARMEMGNQIGAIRYIANSLVFLGLIGTVIGFIIGLSGIDAAATTNVDKIAPMITELINGMSVALYTTLLGAVLNIWLNVNLRILTDGSVRLLALLVEKSVTPATAVATP